MVLALWVLAATILSLTGAILIVAYTYFGDDGNLEQLTEEDCARLLAPDPGWHARRDMDPQFTKPFRASIAARARFIEDLVVEQAGRGLDQYVILGAGLTPLRSAGRRSPRGCEFSKSIVPRSNRGSAGV